MPQTLFKNNWPLGWIPSDDEKNGRSEGLLRMDNLVYDENGVLALSRGTAKVSTGAFASNMTDIFSRVFNLNSLLGAGYADFSKVRYVISNGQCLRNFGPSFKTIDNFELSLFTGGNTDRGAFAAAYGHVFIFSGSKKHKDRGDVQHALGMAAHSAPSVTPTAPIQAKVDNKNGSGFYNNWDTAAVENGGTYVKDGVDYIQFNASATTLRGIVQAGLTTAMTVDATNFGSTGQDTADDLFKFNVRIGDTSKLVKVRVEFLLEAPTAAGLTEDIQNYYWFEWLAREEVDINFNTIADDLIAFQDNQEFIDSLLDKFNGLEFKSFFRQGINVWSVLQCKRSQFNRVGTDDSKNWSAIKGIRVILISIEQTEMVFNDMLFEGGINRNLNGTYSYITVSVRNTGHYNEISLSSAASSEVSVISASVTVDPAQANVQANEVWTFRAGGLLDGYYRVKVQTGSEAFNPPSFEDNVTDIQALRDNIKLEYYRTALPDNVISAIPFFDRLLLFTPDSCYPTFRNDFGSYDSRYKIEICATEGERILFATKLSEGVIVIGTTNDIYYLTGDGSIEDIGITSIINFIKREIGTKQPPVSNAHTVWNQSLIYLSEDGWHILSGSESILLSANLSLLFRKEDRHGINQLRNCIRDSNVFSCGVSKERLVCAVEHLTLGRTLHIYDFNKKYWRFWRDQVAANNPYRIFVEEDGVILYGTESAGDKFLREWDTGTLIDGLTQQTFIFRTIYDHNGQPRNRKDSLTLKVAADNANGQMSITVRGIRQDNSIDTALFSNQQFNGYTEKQWDLLDLLEQPVKYYQVEITGAVTSLKLYNLSIDYEPRPEQQTTLLIRPQDFGVAGRKRIPALPLSIDSLGNIVQFTPIIDTVSYPQSIILKTDKGVHVHQFTSEVIGYDYGGKLATGAVDKVFEFYGIIQPREIEVLPDPIKSKHIPYDNFGTSARKRFKRLVRIIDTKGQNVTWTPRFDSTSLSSLVVNTSRKQSVPYYLTSDIPVMDVGGSLSGNFEFEDYGYSLQECIYEILPMRTKFLSIPRTNFGIAAKKRIRTWPLVLDTFGQNILFKPRVDGISFPQSILQTIGKRTALHFFDTDAFGIDYDGDLDGQGNEFEFYESLKPEDVQILPVAKKFDQFGPIEFDKIGKVRSFRLRILPTGAILPYTIYAEDTVIYTSSITMIVNKENTYEIGVPKGINPTILRVELGPVGQEFHRFYVDFRIQLAGSETQFRTVRIE